MENNSGGTWIEFKVHFKKEYGQMIQEGTPDIMSGEGYVMVFQAVDEDALTIASITKGLTSYAEKQSTTENNVNTLCEQMAFLMHQINV